MSAVQCVFLGLCAAMVGLSTGTAFLKPTHEHHSNMVSAEDVQNSLLAEVEGSLGVGIASKRVNELKALLSPIFKALPKNEHGNLEHVTVRYALHRVFEQRHGWAIKGLDAAGAAWNSSSPTGMLKDQVPAYIEKMFEDKLGGRGLGMQELAVFAATIEHLVHTETIGRLGSVLNVHKLMPTSSVSSAQADKLLDTYMMAFILDEHLPNKTMQEVQEMVDGMPDMFIGWADTQKFVRMIREDLTSTMVVGSAAPDQQLDFAMLAKVAETVGEKFGKFQNADCQGLKTQLVKMEDSGSGRVRLSEFYKPALDGAWHFQESIEYLRQLGALDESNADEPRVMIPNYLTSQANCIASSDYYSVCCLSECEDLMGHLEKEIEAPEATSTRIADLISALPSSSVSAPRQLSATLRTRLDKMGEEHGGQVQIHGRLFAQWMHHAYPRECPYPHMSGTTSQDKAEHWGEDSVATQESIKQYTSLTRSTSSPKVETEEDMHDLMMWSDEEEVLVIRPTIVQTANSGSIAGARNVVMFAALSATVYGLVRTVLPSAGATDKSEKFLV